ncbi:hypothetical protein MLD38_017566 [Melastoma candidum]|uniref:Uncharacterized protein n=1 Tax=Melastoma candidum TaxID=119954 RepID=A0ACB9QSC3_9MYRT|nr:hypothetical protein MLD38_017566 [Melastoma candidum]
MILSWRRLRRAVRQRRDVKNNKVGEREMLEAEAEEVTVPAHFRCPISLDLMRDPVTLSSGMTYDRGSIEAWMEAGNRTCPVTNTALRSLDVVPNHAIRKMIQEWCVENRDHGVERIPTPRIPVSPPEVNEILGRITSASDGKDWVRCRELVAKVRGIIKESERNKKCVRSCGAGVTMARAFEELSDRSAFEENSAMSEGILSTLTAMMPLDVDAQSSLGSANSLNALVWHMGNGSLSARRNSALAIREVVSGNKQKVELLSTMGHARGALFKMIKEPICAASTKSSLVVIYHMVTIDHPLKNKVISEFSNKGLVSLLLETMVDADKSMCEKALGVLDRMCNEEEGRDATLLHPLASPVLVKKLLRVSDLATEFVVSILSNISKDETDDAFWVELLRCGAFQKLLLLFQVGCGERTKEKARELLKSLNVRREGMPECVDGHDFNGLRRHS